MAGSGYVALKKYAKYIYDKQAKRLETKKSSATVKRCVAFSAFCLESYLGKSVEAMETKHTQMY